jgi:regulator of sigma D
MKEKKKSCRELMRKFLEQSKQCILDYLHQGHLLHFKKIAILLEKKET